MLNAVVASFVSRALLGTIIIIFVDCPSPLLFTYMHWSVAETTGGWPCSVAPFTMSLALGPHLLPSKL